MKLNIRKWGNSASLRIPTSIMKAAHIEVDQLVDMREEDGRIIIEPVREGEVALSALLAEITADNLHGETDTGGPVGNEVW